MPTFHGAGLFYDLSGKFNWHPGFIAIDGSMARFNAGSKLRWGEQIEALRRVAGESDVGLIRREPNDMFMKMVAAWATGFEAMRAKSLGFTAETTFDDIIRAHIEDEPGRAL